MSGESWLTPTELGDRLGLSESTIKRRCRTREWPHRRTPHIRFTAADVAEIEALLYQPARKGRTS